MAQNDKDLLVRLKEQNVEFVIIGGVCGILHGATLVTLDLDICCRFSAGNMRRLESAVKDLHPCHRMTPDKMPLELSDELCARLKNLYLQTDLGILDCLSEVAGLGDYDQVASTSIVRKLSYGEFRILNLDALIKSKEAVGREKDLVALKQLVAIKEQIEKPKK